MRDGMLAACEAAGRATPPAVYAGMEVHAETVKRGRIRLDADAVADALGAWQAEGVAHVQVWVRPATGDSYAAVLEGIRRWRG